MKKIDLVILAGGKGTRIKGYLNNNPKPLAKIGNMYFLDYLLNNIAKFYINKIYILAGYKGKAIQKIYNKKEINLIPIEVIIEKKPLGTGGCLSLIKNKISEYFFVVNGDSIFDIDLNKIAQIKLKKNESFIALTTNKNYKSNKKLSNITLKKGLITKNKSSFFMNGGIYYLKKELIKNLGTKNISLENKIISEEIDKRRVTGKYFDNFFIDIGTPENFKKSMTLIPKFFHRPAIFLDRDGTINHDTGYTYLPNKFKLINGTIKALRKLSLSNYYLFIVTNQAGIAKNKFRINDFYNLQNYLKKKFIKENIYINDIRFCPYHPNAKLLKYKRTTNYRKPGNLMLESLKKRWDINIKKSYMVGDKKSDMIAAQKSELKFLYLDKNLYFTLKNIIND